MTKKRYYALLLEGDIYPEFFDGGNDDRLMETEEVEDLLNECEQLKRENSVFKSKDAEHYQRWANQIKKYVEEDNPDFTYNEDFIIKIALSYTLQSLRNGESLKRFQWNYKELQKE